MKAMAEMSDLDSAISDHFLVSNPSLENSTSVPTCKLPTNQQTDDIEFITGEYVVVLFVDGYYPGGVVKSS